MTEPLTFPLNTGARIPALGLGTWQSPQSTIHTAITHALRTGYRYIDTAAMYGNESGVGTGILASGLPRSDIFLTSKLNIMDMHRPAAALDESLKRLQTDYLDLYLIHWPVCVDPESQGLRALPEEEWDFVKTWVVMQGLLETGKVRAIGVSNFQVWHLEKLLAHPEVRVVPAVNQVELHPYNPSPKLVSYCKERGIHLTGYAPIGGARCRLLEDEVVVEVARKVGKTVAQVLLRWGVQRGWDVIVKSVKESRIEENWGVWGWELSEEDMNKLNGIETRFKGYIDDWLPGKVFIGDDE